MKKFNKGYLGLIGIPLAVLGVVGSVALAAPITSAPAPVAVTAPVQVAQSADTDIETNDDATTTEADSKDKPEVAGAAETNDDTDTMEADSKDKADTDIETNDDASGHHEAPGTETAD